jgi:hypothetical protein
MPWEPEDERLSQLFKEQLIKRRFTTDGPVRGECGHKHKYLRTAQECLEKDQRGCANQGGYSDRVIVEVTND